MDQKIWIRKYGIMVFKNKYLINKYLKIPNLRVAYPIFWLKYIVQKVPVGGLFCQVLQARFQNLYFLLSPGLL